MHNVMTTCKSCIVLLLSFLVRLSAGAPLYEGMTRKIQTEAQAKKYLSQFGYLNPLEKNQGSENIMFEDPMTEALKTFQSFFGLNPSGNLDEETLDYMNKPRCGMPDNIRSAKISDYSDYKLAGSRWSVNDLTYTISKYSRQLDKRQTELIFQKAFDVWSSVTPLTFTYQKSEYSGPAAIEIKFETDNHGDRDPFDGPLGTLAHATSPNDKGSYAHFDDSEAWSIDTYYYGGINLFQVAAHEFGHALGLLHSDVKSALMWPHYNPIFNLDADDVKAIQALYGTKSSEKIQGDYNTAPDYNNSPDYDIGRESGEITTDPPDDFVEDADVQLCTVTRINTLFKLADSETFVFKGDYYWKLTDDGLAQGYPKSVSGTWSGLPGNIDTAFTYKNDETYFFKGTKYWKYTGTTMDDGYPKYIADGFPGIPDNVDAVLCFSIYDKIINI